MRRLLPVIISILFPFFTYAQCADGEVALTMNVQVDAWGYETYWEIVPSGNGCGNGTLFSGGNPGVGCDGTPSGGGYASNVTIQEGPFCLTYGQDYDLIFVDSYGDGGLVFELLENGSFSHLLTGAGSGNSLTFTAGMSGLPVNDSPCGALEVTVDGPELELDNTLAVIQLSEPHPANGGCGVNGFWCDSDANINHTVWAYFTAQAGTSYEITTCNTGPGFDTQLAIYRATDCSDFTTFELVAANDDMIGGCTSANGFSSKTWISCVNDGEVYYIQLDGWAGAVGICNLTVSSYTGIVQMNAQVNSINCPLDKGDIPTGSIYPYFTGAGVDFSALWTGPDGYSSDDNYITNLGAGSYSVVVTTACGDTYEGNYLIQQPAMWQVTAELNGPECETSMNGSIDLNVSGASAPYEFIWSGTPAFTANTEDISGLSPGDYIVTINDSRNCQHQMNYSLNTQSDFTFNLGNDTMICIYNDLMVVGPPGYEYAWQDGSTNQFFLVDGEDWGLGTYPLVLTITSDLGCTYSDYFAFTVDECVGVEELLENGYSLWPNPSRGAFSLHADVRMENAVMEVYDTAGRLAASVSGLNGNNALINVALPAGLYTIVIRNGEHRFHIRHIVE